MHPGGQADDDDWARLRRLARRILPRWVRRLLRRGRRIDELRADVDIENSRGSMLEIGYLDLHERVERFERQLGELESVVDGRPEALAVARLRLDMQAFLRQQAQRDAERDERLRDFLTSFQMSAGWLSTEAQRLLAD